MSQYYALTRFLKHQSSRFLFFYLVSFAVLNIILFLSAGKVYSGQATLSWDPPTTNADGTRLTDLGGYKVYYGILSGNYSQKIDAGNVTTYTVSLSDGTYYFAVTAYDTSRNESDYSNEVNKTIRSVQQYTLTVNKNGTGTGTITGTGINCGSDCTEPYNQGTIVTLTATAATGSAFTGWSGGGCTGAGTCSTTINANTTVTANFNKNTYTYAITATAGTGGNISPSGTVTVNQGANQTFMITPNTGYHITDVKVDGTSVGAVSAYTFTNVTANHTISASFTMNTYSFDTSAQEIIIDNGDPGTSYTGAWYVSSGIDPYDTDSLWSRNGTYTWTFTPQQAGVYELSMWWTYLGSRGTNIPVDIEYSEGAAKVYINQQQNGGIWNSFGTYLFAAGTSYKVTITAEGSLTACADAVKFVYVSGGNVPPAAYTITAAAGTGGSISPSGTVTVNQGVSQTFTIIPDAGYHITDVKIDGKSVGAVSAYTFNNITANHSISATFAIDTYTVTAAAGAGGTITPSGTVTVNQGANKTFTIIPDAGYHITDVKVDGSSMGAVSAYTFNNITANHSIGATFAIDAPAQEIIIDNGDPGTSYTGAWYVSSGIGPYNTDSLWSREGTYTWTFTPQQAGVYELSMWWTYYASRSANIPVDIEYSGGTTRVYISQQQNGSIWNSLGTYLFAAGTSYKVTITAGGSLTTCADAVKFVQKLYNY